MKEEQFMEVPESTRQGIYKYLGEKTDGFLSDVKNSSKDGRYGWT